MSESKALCFQAPPAFALPACPGPEPRAPGGFPGLQDCQMPAPAYSEISGRTTTFTSPAARAMDSFIQSPKIRDTETLRSPVQPEGPSPFAPGCEET